MAAASYETPQRATALVHVTALQITCPAGHVLLPRVISQISSRYIPHGRSDQNIGRKLLLPGDAPQAHAGRQLICAPPDPRIIRLTVRKYAAKGDSDRGAPRSKSLAA